MPEPYFECSECGSTVTERDVIAELPGFDGASGNRVVFCLVQPSCVHDGVPLPMVRKGL